MSAVPVNRIDPITVEVIGSALSSIVEEMGEALVRASCQGASGCARPGTGSRRFDRTAQ
jgi:hypothetical protein